MRYKDKSLALVIEETKKSNKARRARRLRMKKVKKQKFHSN